MALELRLDYIVHQEAGIHQVGGDAQGCRCQRQVQGGSQTRAQFYRASQHGLDAGLCGQVEESLGPVQAAGLHRDDVEDIDRPVFDQCQGEFI